MVVEILKIIENDRVRKCKSILRTMKLFIGKQQTVCLCHTATA